MADLSKSLKDIWMKGMEAIGDTATRIAENTKYKVNEMNLTNRRHEILTDFGAKSYALWQQGEKFPAELDALLTELDALEKELGAIQAKKAAAKPEPEMKEVSSDTEEIPAEENAPTEEETAAEEGIPVEEVPTINVEE